MIGFLIRDRVRINIRIRVRVGVMFNVRVYRWSNCRWSKCRTFQEIRIQNVNLLLNMIELIHLIFFF